MSSTSVGRGPASGGNENHDGDPSHKTLGEAVGQEAPAGSVAPEPAPATQPEGGRKPATGEDASPAV
jgi:hypothetical protein